MFPWFPRLRRRSVIAGDIKPEVAEDEVRDLQRVERAPTGRQLLTRFMVRGHWRRAAPGWKDQRPRWIEPHWRGPEIAAVVERAYRLKP